MTLTPPNEIPVAGFQAEFPEPRFVKIACPQCGSKNLNLIEKWQTQIEWKVTKGWMDRAAGYKQEGKPVGCSATCIDCRHEWTPRNALQIERVLESN